MLIRARLVSRRVAVLATAGSILLLVGVIAAAAMAWSQEAAVDSTAVAHVDGSPISRTAFDAYAGVFTDPNGELQVSRDQVLLSLINQKLVSREASRLGVRVDPASVDDAIKEWQGLDVLRRSLERSGGIDALRARFEAFIELKQVKTLVVDKVDISDDQVRTAYQSQFNLPAFPLEEVADVLRERLTETEIERRWTVWLARQRECSRIEILDPSFDLPSSSPVPGCGPE